MPYRDNQQAFRALNAVATTQGGYFTAKQAGAAGYGIRHLDYHAKTGNLSASTTDYIGYRQSPRPSMTI